MKRKRRMLEDEGVLFERDGGVDKICEHFFKCKRDSGSISTSNVDQRKLKIAKKTDDDEASTHQMMVNGITEDKLKEEILTLLRKRCPGKTC